MIGRTIGKYRIVGQLGRGGAGIVYKAVDETLNRDVAIKALNPDLADTEVMSRFQAEATILAKLNHPQIATIYELFRSDTDLLMVMEFVRGESLDKLSERIGPIRPDRAAYLIDLILSALEHAHRAGIVHRDVKPANVMVTDEGSIKIMDFGIARVLGAEQKTIDGRLMGTPAYMAPEQVLGHEVDARADLYSVGVVFYRLLAGALPFTADTALGMLQRQIRDTPIPLAAHRANLPDWCDTIVQKALAKSSTDRFQSAEEFRETLARSTGPLSVADLAKAFAAAGRDDLAAVPATSDTINLAHADLSTSQPAPPVKKARRTRFAWAYPAAATLALVLVVLGYAAPRLYPIDVSMELPAPPEAQMSAAMRPASDFDASLTSVALSSRPISAETPDVPEPSAPVIPPPAANRPETTPSEPVAAEPIERRASRASSIVHEPSLVFETRALVGTRKPREQSAQLVLGDGKITVIPLADPTSRLCSIPYERVISIILSKGRDPMWNSPQGRAPVARAGGTLGRLGISIAREWITLRTSTEEQFVAMRFDEVLMKRVLLALEERTGSPTELVAPEPKEEK